MSPVDSIRPPKKIKKTSAAKNPKPKIAAAANPKKILPVKSQPGILQQPAKQHEDKKKLMWLLVGVTGLIIIIAWLWYMQNGGMNINANRSNRWQELGQKIDEAWLTIKTDWLKIKKITQPTNAINSEEHIKNLEERVFPQFNDPTKQ